MTPCDLCRQGMAEAVYDDLDEARKQVFAQHLDECSACAAEYKELRSTVALLRTHAEPRPQAPEVWDRLEGELDRIDVTRRRRRAIPWLLATAAVILLWFILPHRLQPNPQPSLAETPKPHPDLMLAQFLSTSQPLLLAVANRDEATPEHISEEKKRAAALAQQAAELGRQLDELGAKRSRRELVADLETLFLQMSNLNRRDYNEGLMLIRTQLHNRDILFRITLNDMRVQRLAAK